MTRRRKRGTVENAVFPGEAIEKTHEDERQRHIMRGEQVLDDLDRENVLLPMTPLMRRYLAEKIGERIGWRPW